MLMTSRRTLSKLLLMRGIFDLTANRKKPAIEIAANHFDAKPLGNLSKSPLAKGLRRKIKLISQVASNLNKPDAYLTFLKGDEKTFLHPLPNRWLPGIGPKSAVRLNAAGLGSNRPNCRYATRHAFNVAPKPSAHYAAVCQRN